MGAAGWYLSMSNSQDLTTFRAPVDSKPHTSEVSESVEKSSKTSEVVSSESKKELSPLLYVEENKKPYVAKYWGVEDITKTLDRETLTNMEFVDDYFKQLVDDGKYENDKVGYKEFMKKMEKTADVEHAPLRTKAGRISEFVKYMLRSKKYGSTR